MNTPCTTFVLRTATTTTAVSFLLSAEEVTQSTRASANDSFISYIIIPFSYVKYFIYLPVFLYSRCYGGAYLIGPNFVSKNI